MTLLESLNAAYVAAGCPTQAELGQRINRSRSQISEWLSGVTRPNARSIALIAQACGVTISRVASDEWKVEAKTTTQLGSLDKPL